MRGHEPLVYQAAHKHDRAIVVQRNRENCSAQNIHVQTLSQDLPCHRWCRACA